MADEFLEVMRQTRSRFASEFEARLDRMRELASAAGASELDALKHEAHQIAGLSGTLGFAATGDDAAALESFLGASGTGGFDSAEALRRLDGLSESFHRERGERPSWEE